MKCEISSYIQYWILNKVLGSGYEDLIVQFLQSVYVQITACLKRRKQSKFKARTCFLHKLSFISEHTAGVQTAGEV